MLKLRKPLNLAIHELERRAVTITYLSSLFVATGYGQINVRFTTYRFNHPLLHSCILSRCNYRLVCWHVVPDPRLVCSGKNREKSDQSPIFFIFFRRFEKPTFKHVFSFVQSQTCLMRTVQSSRQRTVQLFSSAIRHGPASVDSMEAQCETETI